jgi:hypothetical protein
MNTETVAPRLIGSSALLAGLSVLTVINLKHSQDEYINVTHAGPAENGKYLGWITTHEGRPVINTEPIFDTPADAEAHMRRVIAAAREWENPANTRI